ncbi:MAG: hypothetical protein ACOZJX_19420 [Pseudomonadota bacterium]
MTSLKAALLITLSVFGASAHADGNPEFIDFAVKQAHRLNFKGCDVAIRDIFKNAGGKDIRVWTDYLEENRADQLQLSGTYGNDGDMVLIDASLRRIGGKCLAQISSNIALDQSCPSYLSDNPVWKVETTTGDIMAAKNPNGVSVLLRPVARSCVITFRRGMVYKAS